MNLPAQHPVGKNPLVLLALSLAAGMLAGNYSQHPLIAITLTLAVALGLLIAISHSRSSATTVTFLLLLFAGTGYFLTYVDARRVSPDRLVRMFASGALQSNEPVEVTGIIEGEPE